MLYIRCVKQNPEKMQILFAITGSYMIITAKGQEIMRICSRKWKA